ncbi:MAG: class I SAM-dependent methyltransferase [Planctomycetaceae bacterium]
MSDLSLLNQLIAASQSLYRRLDELPASDPNWHWFAIELQRLAVAKGDLRLPLHESHARLSALNQLMHLLRNHCIRLKNPGFADSVGETDDSYLTVQARLPSTVLSSTRDLQFSIQPSLIHEATPDNQQFDPVSPTAKIVAYLRALDSSLQIDGGFSKDTEGESILLELGIRDDATQAGMAVLFQSRYHAINAAVSALDRDVLQVIELAAGISPRGYQWSQMNPGTIYIESDLPQLMIHKAKLIRNARLRQDQKCRGIHHCCAVDVLNLESLLNAVEILDTDNAFTIVTEGLLLYFSRDEMQQFLQNIKAVLLKHPNAVWVTDFVTQKNLQELFSSRSGIANGVRNVFSLTGRDVVPSNPLIDDSYVKAMLAESGLQVLNTILLAQATERVRLELNVPPKQRAAIVGTRKIWRVSSQAGSGQGGA